MATASTTGAIMALAVLVITLPASVADGLIYQRAAILDGQIWRLLTAHWVHLDATHMLINVAGLAAVVLVLGRFLSPVRLLRATAFSAFSVSLGLLLLAPHLQWYVGLSGVVSGIWAAAALHGTLRQDWLGYAAIALLAAKLVWEQVHGAPVALSAELRDPVIVDAHLYGMLGGLLAALLPAQPGNR